jgi:hypothetical protein
MAAFNQASYHNLYDIWNFLTTNSGFSAWFVSRGNPCSACHNSHLAKRNWDSLQAGFPLLSSISMPGGSGTLWGETEVMSAYAGYEAPYAFSPAREPAGVGTQNGTNTPDYVIFCTSCHNPDTTITRSPLNEELTKINWTSNGLSQDKHGDMSRDGTDNFREPYQAEAIVKRNFILSCLDCHESHGSANIMMLRTRINGQDQAALVDSTDNMSYACSPCHPDDRAAGNGNKENQWEYVHHLVPDAPYLQQTCNNCHAGGGKHIDCGNCHGHGMDDSWLGTYATGRRTF